MLDVWQGCQQYYYRCISRKAQFTTSLASPSKVSQGASCVRCMAGLSAVLLQVYIKKGSVTASLASPSKVSQGASCVRCMAGLSAVLLQVYIKKGSVYCLLSLPF